jgi:cell division transport system permease protein
MNRRTQKNRLKPAAPPKAAARAAARAPRLGLRAWREQHLYSLFSSLGRIAARPWATLLTLLVMALALALPLLLFVLLDNAQQLRGDMQEAGAISVFLKPNQEAAVAETLAKRLRARAGVASVLVKTPEQGLQEFRSQSGFADAMKVLRENPLPAVLIVTPRADAAGADAPALLAGSLGAEPEVDLVQYDAAWRQRLDAILAAATRFAEVLAGLLALAALLVVGNTVRLDILGRAEEITVMQLLGASSAFVRRPFLYTGLWYGAFSATLALAVVAVVELLLFKPLADLVASYDHRFAIHGVAWMPALATLGLGAALGWLGAWLAASRHLLRGTPR